MIFTSLVFRRYFLYIFTCFFNQLTSKSNSTRLLRETLEESLVRTIFTTLFDCSSPQSHKNWSEIAHWFTDISDVHGNSSIFNSHFSVIKGFSDFDFLPITDNESKTTLIGGLSWHQLVFYSKKCKQWMNTFLLSWSIHLLLEWKFLRFLSVFLLPSPVEFLVRITANLIEYLNQCQPLSLHSWFHSNLFPRHSSFLLKWLPWATVKK